MKHYPENECSCKTCAAMCEHRPCWGSPEDIEKIIDAGLAYGLMEDYWVGGGTEGNDILIPSPAIRGYEGRRAPLHPMGQCTFLKDGLCGLHDQKLKPIEGRVASCKQSKKQDKIHGEMRAEIVAEWNTDEGRRVLAKWKEAIGMKANEDMPPTGFEMLLQIAEMLKGK